MAPKLRPDDIVLSYLSTSDDRRIRTVSVMTRTEQPIVLNNVNGRKSNWCFVQGVPYAYFLATQIESLDEVDYAVLVENAGHRLTVAAHSADDWARLEPRLMKLFRYYLAKAPEKP